MPQWQGLTETPALNSWSKARRPDGSAVLIAVAVKTRTVVIPLDRMLPMPQKVLCSQSGSHTSSGYKPTQAEADMEGAILFISTTHVYQEVFQREGREVRAHVSLTPTK